MRTDFFNEAIVTALLAASSPGGAPPDAAAVEDAEEDLGRADVLRERLAALLERADRAAVQAGIPKDAVEAADFAVCAFIDEALLSSASWRGRVDWLKNPLQFVRHGTATAGEDFYRILDSLLEEAENKAAVPLPLTEDAVTRPAPEEDDARDPRRAAPEIFALCLAQGFTGMFYGDPAAIRDRLEKIGRLVPAVGHRGPFFVPSEKKKERRPLRTVAGLFRRFDPLDWLLWLIPPALTALFYWVCETRLDQLLQPFLQGSAPS